MSKIIRNTIILICMCLIATGHSVSYFSDTEVSSNNCFWVEQTIIDVPDILITEVYYAHTSYDWWNENKREWVEIYNTTSSSINLQNWKLQDNASTLTLPNITIPANSYAVIAHQNNDNLPGGILEINPNWPDWFYWPFLSNSGDRLYLKKPDNTHIDTMSYGYDTMIFNPACPSVVAGHSLERSSVMIDTDTAADWVDQDTPTPGAPYVP